MTESFEQFTASILKEIARGRSVLYNESLKAYTIKFNSWFTRTIFVNDLWDEWKAKA